MPKKRKIHKLSDVRVTEVSLVDFPANAGSTVVLMKRGDPNAAGAAEPTMEDDMPKTMEELAKALETAEADIAKRDEQVEALKADIAKRDEQITALTAEVDEIKKGKGWKKGKKGPSGDDGDDDDGDDVMKALPEDLRKRFDDMEAELNKRRDADAIRTWVEKSGSLDNLALKAHDFGPVLKRIAAGESTADDATEVLKVLTAANEAAAAVTVQKGSDAARPATEGAKGKLDELAKARATEKGIPFHDAYTQVVAEQPALYADVLAGK